MIPPNRATQKGGETLNRLLRLFSVRSQEALPALLMAVYFFLAMACVSMVKSLQIALYLSRVGFDWRLPSLYTVLVLLSGLIVLLYRYLARQYSHLGIALSTLVFFILSLVFFWFLVGREQLWVYLTFYIWGGLFSLLLPTLGWVIALDLYNTREAKRLFALFGTGGILGGACGGYYIALVSGTLDARWLFIHVLVTLFILQGVLLAIYRVKGSRLLLRHPTPSETLPSPTTASALRDLLASPYLTYLAGIVLVSAFTTTLIDLQYQWFLERRYPGSEEQITWFVGTLLGTMYVFSALFQLFATRSVLRNFGVGVALLVLPLALLGGSASIVILAGFGAVVTFKGIDGFLRPSIHRTGLEVLYVPISSPQTVTLKSFIDLAVFRFGDALGAAFFLAATSLFVTPVAAIQTTILLAALGWAFLALQLGRQYVESLRQSLEGKSARRLPPSLLLEGAGAQIALLEALESLNPNKVHFALEQLAAVNPSSEEGTTTELPVHGEELLQSQVPSLYPVSQGWLETVEPLVNHVDSRVGAAAFHVLVRQDPTKYLERLKEKLESKGVPETVYLHYLDLYSEDPASFITPSQLLQWSRDERADMVSILARLMGKIKSPAFLPVLRTWMSGLPGEPARAAIEAIGQYAEPRLLDALISLLEPNWSRPAACRALIHYGDAAVSRLRELLRYPAVGPFIARQIPFILTRINSSSSRAGLVTALYSADPAVSYSALKGLNKIRDSQDLSYTQGSFMPLLQIWAKQYYELVNIESMVSKREGNVWELLRKTNGERMDWTIEKIFRGLELFLPRGDAYFSYLGYTSSKQELRENAIELIDARIKGELRQTLLPIFSGDSRHELARTGRRLFHLPSDRDGIALDALSDVDSWLRCCVMAALREQPSPILEKAVRMACQDVDSVVQETAQWVLTSMAKAPAIHDERRSIMLTTIEKVLLLKEVELFSSASTDHLAQLAQLCQEKLYKAGESLFQKGEPHSKFFLLVEGSVSLDDQENEETVGKCALDFWSWVGQTPHEVSAKCVDDCTVLLLPFQDLVDLLCGEPGLSWAILQYLAKAGRVMAPNFPTVA